MLLQSKFTNSVFIYFVANYVATQCNEYETELQKGEIVIQTQQKERLTRNKMDTMSQEGTKTV